MADADEIEDLPSDDELEESDAGWIEFDCLEVRQPIGTFYIGVMASDDVVNVSYSDIRRMEMRDIETYLGIERPLDRKRTVKMADYVRNVDASFPSTVIVAVRAGDTEYDSETRRLSLRDKPEVAKILDGQHRIAALEGYQGPPFDLIVTIFVDMDIEDQALVFATINLEQTKVNKSLAYDLYEYAKSRSPQKSAHNIVRVLDTRKGSPFEGKIKILGTAGDPGEIISQAVFIDALLPYISKDARKDRDTLKRKKKPDRAVGSEEQELIFRNMFLDERDADIARVLWNYFAAVEAKWGAYWTTPQRGYVLNRTTGFRALMQFLRYAYLHLGNPGDVVTEKQFGSIFSRIQLSGQDITRDNFPPGSGGQSKLRRMLLSQTGLG